MANTQKKMTPVERTKHRMRLEAERSEKERKEALGLAETEDGAKRRFGLNGLLIMKIVLLCLFPIAFFMYSPLLLPVAAAYAATFFIARGLQHKVNQNLKKGGIKLFKLDAIFAVALVGVALLGGIVFSSTSEQSVFEGDRTKIESVLKTNFGQSSIQKTADVIEKEGLNINRHARNTMQIFSLGTGERELFIFKYTSLFGFGSQVAVEGRIEATEETAGIPGNLIVKADDGAQLASLTLTEDRKTGLHTGATKGFLNFIVVLNTALIVATVASGIYGVLKLKKLKQ
jgi:hypothetical protein